MPGQRKGNHGNINTAAPRQAPPQRASARPRDAARSGKNSLLPHAAAPAGNAPAGAAADIHPPSPGANSPGREAPPGSRYIMDAFSDAFFQLLQMLLHIDVYLRDLVNNYGPLVYLFLFIVVFCETGLVVTPFLPGDSLLFAGGTLAGAGLLSYPGICAVLLAAAITGDAVNFRIGKYVGPPIFQRDYRWLKRKHLMQAHEFYERHGGKAIILARFIPIIRTFAPFVAGVAGMCQSRFTFFNVTGALIWVFLIVTAGYFLGSREFVQKNFSLIIYGIIVASVLPVVFEAAKQYLAGKRRNS